MSCESADSSRTCNYTLPEHCWPWREDQEEGTDCVEAWLPEHLFYLDDGKWCPWIEAKLEYNSGTHAQVEAVQETQPGWA